jgi:hypothetical protein
VQDTLKAVVKLVLLHLTRKYDPSAAPRPEAPASVSVPAVPEVPLAAAPAVAPLPTPAMESAPGAASTQAIPLSNFALPEVGSETAPSSAVPESISENHGPPPPPDFRGTGPELDEPAPAFAEHEIDDLVDEVEDVEDFGELGGGPSIDDPLAVEQPLAASAPESPNFDDTPAFDEPSPAPVEASFGGDLGSGLDSGTSGQEPPFPPTAMGGDLGVEMNDGAIGEPETSAESTDSETDRLQVDREFDPEWGMESPEGTASPSDEIGEPEESAARSVESDATADVDFGSELPDSASPGDAVVLTELASDRDLFEDPDVEVARLDSIEDREIVVPVEVGEGSEKRRFKLSIRLHLDPVD